MSSVSIAEPQTRMKAEDRRELVLRAATAVFGERGYVGTTTDAIAKTAGVSQPYVVRIFGTKEALFLAVLTRALDRLLGAFRKALAGEGPKHPAGDDANNHQRLGAAYAELLSDRGLLLSLMHGFVLGSDPVIGACAREGFLKLYRLLRDEAGFTREEVHSFLAEGMLLNTLVGIRMAAAYDDPTAKELLDTALPTKIGFLLGLERTQGSV